MGAGSTTEAGAVDQELDRGGGRGGHVHEQYGDPTGVPLARRDAQDDAGNLRHAPGRRLPGHGGPGPDHAALVALDQGGVAADVVEAARDGLALQGEAHGQVHDDPGSLAALVVPHRTFTTTSVRASAREASPRNRSTSDRILSPLSAAVPVPAVSSWTARRAGP